jgi:16S rRNA (guanine1207-N2)-methyltransferase
VAETQPRGNDASGQYFESEPASPSRPRQIRLDLPDRSLRFTTDRGVFSGDRVDPGTKYLLLDAPAPPGSGALVDLGCGYGPIACALASRAPRAEVWAVDVNERALELCRANAAANDLPNVRVATPDEVPADVRFELLWSNPPIRVGKPVLHELLSTWLGRLTPTGTAVLVVQKHLGSDSLQRWLQSEGHRADRVGSRAGYRLLRIRARGEAGG